MNRKLMLLNLALLALCVAGAADLYRRYQSAQERYRILDQLSEPKETAALPPAPEQPRVRPADFMPIAERLLFSPDRNPVVEVEAPAPPAPKQRPAYPKFVGLMDLGAGPLAFMSATAKGAPEPVGVGDKIGEFTLVAFGDRAITLEWQGEQMEVPHEQLTGADEEPTQRRRPGSSAAARPAPPPAKPSSRTPADAANLQAGEVERVGGEHNIGKELRPGVFAADPKDDAPDGTEYRGYVKRVRKTPFGSQAWWEKKDQK